MPFKLALKQEKYLNMTLTKHARSYIQYTVKLMKQIKEVLSKWRNIPWSWLRTFSITKISVLFNVIYRFKTIPLKISTSYFIGIDKQILKFTRKNRRPRTTNPVLKRYS